MKRRTETEITKNWPKGDNTPLVTVIAICYCHEKYLRTALDSILAQQTSFTFEVVIHDDSSTDGSVAIIEEYAKEYPHIIKPILEQENQFSKGIKSLIRAIKPSLKGKYFAYLECDDYWTDTHKLQEQIDFLEAHPAYLAVAHNCTVVDINGKATGEQYPECKDEEFTMEHFMNETLAGQLSTLVVRNIFTQVVTDHHLITNMLQGPFDRVIYLTLLFNGRVHCIQKSMSAYRHIINSGTSFSATYHFDIQREMRFYLSLVLYCKRMGRIGDAIGMQRWLVDFLEKFVAGGIIDEKEAAPYLDMCKTSIASLSDRLMGKHKHCVCCKKDVLYKSLPIEQQEATLFVDRFILPETLNPDDYLCPECKSVDKDRLMISALEQMELNKKGSDYHILQLTTSTVLDQWISKHSSCVSCETYKRNAERNDSHIDLKDINLKADKSYDLILCSDVLEYVQDDAMILQELKRILKDDGCILLLVPVDLGFSNVDEAWGLSDEENYHRFGQENLVRRYSREGLLERLSKQFEVNPLGKEYFGENCFWNAGLSDSSTLYVLSKPEHSIAFTKTKYEEMENLDAKLVVYIQEPGDTFYSESKSIRTSLPSQNNYGCTLPLSEFKEISHIRIDPMECPCFFKEISVSLMTIDGKRIPVENMGTNGITLADGMLFNSDDPQIELDISQGKYSEVSFFGELISNNQNEIEHLWNISSELSKSEKECDKLKEELAHTMDVLTQTEDNNKKLEEKLILLDESEKERNRLSKELTNTIDTLIQIQTNKEKLELQLEQTKHDYELISNSMFWKITKPARTILDALKKFIHICKSRINTLK